MSDQQKPSVVVTGASRGIGREIARHLSARGFDVFAGTRATSENTRDEPVHTIMLDVSDRFSVERTAQLVAEAVGGRGLFALVNNAALFSMAPLEQAPYDSVVEQFRVNVIGALAVTQALLPLIRTARGRIINISSINGLFAVPFSGVYCATKFALEALSDALRMELKPWGIHVVVIEPGAFKTDIRTAGLDAWRKLEKSLGPDARGLYQSSHEKIRDLLTRYDTQAPPPTPVAEAVLEALTTATPAARYVVGIPRETVQALTAMPEQERDRELMREIEG